MKICGYFVINFRSTFLVIKIFQRKFVEKIKTHFVTKKCFFGNRVG